MPAAPVYDEIGLGYARYRQPDPRIAARIDDALGAARTVLNVGAGTGSYEPANRQVTAVEPSAEMIRQRSLGAARCVQAAGEALPFADQTFDSATAVLTVHHWRDAERGLREMARVAAGLVILTFDPAVHNDFWLFRDYVPAVLRLPSTAGVMTPDEIATVVDADWVDVVPVPHDCRDGFGIAYWRRPERYLERDVQRCISAFGLLPANEVEPGLARLRADLASGRWHERYGDLLHRDNLDAGLRLVVRNAQHEMTVRSSRPSA